MREAGRGSKGVVSAEAQGALGRDLHHRAQPLARLQSRGPASVALSRLV